MTAPNSIKTCKSVDPKEELLIDLDAGIKETQLTVGTLNQVKQTIMNNSNIVSHTFCSSLSQFTIEPTFPFPEFIHWEVKNYVPSTRQILSTDGTRVIATINSKSLRKAFYLPVSNPNQTFVQFSEENNMVVIKALDAYHTCTFMSKLFRPDVSPSNYTFPYDISLFIETIQAIFALLSQILGLDSDQFVTEVMVGTIFLISQSTKKFTLNFEQFMVDKISYQLEHFHIEGKVFSYQTLLLLIVIIENLTELRQIEPVNFSDAIDLFERNATISYFTFANSIIPAIYKVIFGSTMPTISEDLKLLLQNPTKLIGDWFC